MGASSSKVYLGSPYTVAASAITGRITDPRNFLQGDA
jgi:3-isopropylmalate/(R)-2-methylmalate dehydratase large subunit